MPSGGTLYFEGEYWMLDFANDDLCRTTVVYLIRLMVDCASSTFSSQVILYLEEFGRVINFSVPDVDGKSSDLRGVKGSRCLLECTVGDTVRPHCC